MKPGRWLGYGVGGWLLWRLYGPEVVPRFPFPQMRPLRVPGRTVMIGERELFVRESGPADGPALVLIHGWNLDGEMTFHRLVPLLDDRFRVIIPDLRNHGKSDWVRGRVELAEIADEVAGLLDVLGVSGATVMGYSMGGMVAQELARRHPRVVGRLILAATAAHPIARARGMTRAVFWLGRGLLRLSSLEVAGVTRRLLSADGALRPENRAWMHQGLVRRDANLYYEIGAAVWRFDSRSWVGGLQLPILVLINTEDQVVPPEAQYELAGLLSDAAVVEIVGGFHESVMNRAEEVAEAVAGFASLPL